MVRLAFGLLALLRSPVERLNFGDINIQGGSPQAASQGTTGAAGRQLKDAITGVINEQASMPGSPLWRLIKGV